MHLSPAPNLPQSSTLLSDHISYNTMSPISSSALELLRKALSPNASVNLPDDPDYTNKRWARNAEKTAAIVTCPVTAEDVAQIIAFAQGKAPYDAQQKLDMAVKGGGHTPSGASSSEGGLVIDLNPKMHTVRVDPDVNLAYVQGGALWADVDEATFPHGLASVSGVVSHTGVGRRLILGGGFGWLCSQYGLVIDNLAQATVVTSSGSILTASDSENVDLFWAIRGGGANFGVVTEFVLKLHEQRPELWGGMLIYPPTILDKLVPEVNSWLSERTPIENVHLVFMSGPGGPGVGLQIVYNGDAETGAKKFERFTKLDPIMAKLGPIPYLQLNRMQARFICGARIIPLAPRQLRTQRSNWTAFGITSGSVLIWELYHAGAFSSVPKEATAYGNRAPTYNVGYFMNWSDPAWTEQSIPTVLALDKEFMKLRDAHFHRDLVGEGGYLNYRDAESQKTGASRRFGSHFPRLLEIKRKYDPENLFGKWFALPAQI
ncbi:unnamed protein product [Rhizoctonia solani]|uniref:FAD-binding PCMH-type domain-containing protein n=1 Tax=Rhizoctonia solani TaxID=456999 RepID=A0A8H2WCF2_9AGAM|nr:unnamed protein product [Rhizoctonia solani]